MQSSRARPRLDLLLAFLAFALAALALYLPALRGAWIGDDWGYIVNNPYVRDLDAARLARLLLDASFGVAQKSIAAETLADDLKLLAARLLGPELG